MPDMELVVLSPAPLDASRTNLQHRSCRRRDPPGPHLSNGSFVAARNVPVPSGEAACPEPRPARLRLLCPRSRQRNRRETHLVRRPSPFRGVAIALTAGPVPLSRLRTSPRFAALGSLHRRRHAKRPPEVELAGVRRSSSPPGWRARNEDVWIAGLLAEPGVEPRNHLRRNATNRLRGLSHYSLGD